VASSPDRNFKAHRPTQLGILRSIDFTISARTDLADDAIVDSVALGESSATSAFYAIALIATRRIRVLMSIEQFVVRYAGANKNKAFTPSSSY
jgi:hypothetical protein